jgi:UDP-N-acetylglucosamine:LPS N-acetylglucosamine transferase
VAPGTGRREPLGRVVVVSASAGAGHDGASRELGRRLAVRGLAVDHLDLAELFPVWLGRALQHTYHGMVRRLPWLYGALFAVGSGYGGAGAGAQALLRPLRPRLLRALPPDTRVVVAAYPLVSQLLGPLRRSGELVVPVVTYLTDFGVNPIWVAPGVDLYCAAHPVSREWAYRLGAAEVRVAGRVVDPAFRAAGEPGRVRARDRFGLPRRQRLALLVAGSWGVGQVARAAAEVAAAGVAVPVVVCGRNEALRRRLRHRGLRHVFGWVRDMPELLRAADVLVENAGGLTALEAMASGVPVLTYRPIPGHGRDNAAGMAAAGVSTWVRHPGQLGPALVGLADGPAGARQRAAGLALFDADPTDQVTALALGRREPVAPADGVAHPAG